MTGIVPCLYNSFSFHRTNLEGGNIICYDPTSRSIGDKRVLQNRDNDDDCSHAFPSMNVSLSSGGSSEIGRAHV